jgi:serine/threonine protein kinase
MLIIRDKRVQMIREVTALFQLLRETSRAETNFIKRPEHYIVDFFDAFSNPEEGVVCLMIEYMDGGSLQDIVDQGGCDDEMTLANISLQALKGLSFLHSSSQIHRDLKPGKLVHVFFFFSFLFRASSLLILPSFPVSCFRNFFPVLLSLYILANFLISNRGEVKVADLGIMKQLPPKVAGKLQKTNSFVGTATYMSPERIDGKDYSFSADVWALGLSIATIALGKLPLNTKGGYWTILHGIRDEPPPQLPANRFSPEFCDFIACCLRKNPEKRLCCKELMRHPFLVKASQSTDDADNPLLSEEELKRNQYELYTVFQAIVKHIDALKKNYQSKYGHSSLPLNHHLSSGSDESTSTAGGKKKRSSSTRKEQTEKRVSFESKENEEALQGMELYHRSSSSNSSSNSSSSGEDDSSRKDSDEGAKGAVVDSGKEQGSKENSQKNPKQGGLQVPNTKYQKYYENRSVIHEKLFGDLLENSSKEIFKQIVFGPNTLFAEGNDGNSSAGNLIGKTLMISKTGRLIKPRLKTLSKQLNLPLEYVLKEAKIFYDQLE